MIANVDQDHVTLVCGGCGALSPIIEGSTRSHIRARQAAAKEGWTHPPGGWDDRCSTCARTVATPQPRPPPHR